MLFNQIWKGSSKISLKSLSNFDATAPSNDLWSAEMVDFIVCPTSIVPLLITGFWTMDPTAIILDCGGLIIAWNSVIPNIPKFEIVSKKFNFYKTFITNEMLKKNILATNYMFVSVAHTKSKVDRYLKHLNLAFEKISQMENNKKKFYIFKQASFFKK